MVRAARPTRLRAAERSHERAANAERSLAHALAHLPQQPLGQRRRVRGGLLAEHALQLGDGLARAAHAAQRLRVAAAHAPVVGAHGEGLLIRPQRGRVAALTGDKMMMMPVLVDAGNESWRAKEAKAPDDALPGFGPVEERGPLWEALTATNMLQAGTDLIVMRHPKAIDIVRKSIGQLCPADIA